MKKIELYPNNISQILIENLNNNSLFIFPTDVVMNSWIDWIITHPTESNTEAVAFEKFTAWDNFKRDFVSAHKEGEHAVPTILRKMFITNFIAENNNKPREKRLQVIINPNFSSEADSFSDWLSKNIQSLHFWKKRLDENINSYGNLDKEDQDYLYLYEEYSKFLEKNNLFEPAWIDNIDFKDNSKTFHIFYPELLEDFLDYKDIFSEIPNINIYTLPENMENPSAYFYQDSRSELRQTILSMIDLVNKGKADFSEIVLSVPNLDIYRPYIDREFKLYNIPYVIKAGVPLTTNSAGRIFREIYDCYNNNFSFDSVRTLLLDECVPWREEFKQIKEDLIREGNRMRCICSIDKDIWLRAFQTKINNLSWHIKDFNPKSDKAEIIKNKIIYYEDIKAFYQKLKNTISLFFPTVQEANTFENIRICWMNFKAQFLKTDNDFTEDANNILSRCIKELNEIIQIEKDFSECNLFIPSPYKFFLQELDKKTYTKQTQALGVTIFPYKLSAAGYFKYQFIIDCSQKNLDISYKRLTYLNNTKRNKLKLTDDDKMIKASEVFIKLYGKGNNDIVHFSAAENTFNGFAIPHSHLKILKDNNSNNILPNFDNGDYIIQEKNLFNDQNKINIPIKITENQKQSYVNWKKSSIENNNNFDIMNNKIREDIHYTLVEHRTTNANDNDKIKITARGDLEQFFPCPRKWLFKSVLKLHDDTLDTNLMQGYDMGNLNHKIMESFMTIYKDKTLPYYDINTNDFFIKKIKTGELEAKPENCTEEILNILYGNDNIVEKTIKAPSDFRDSPLVIDSLLSQKSKIADTIFLFIKKLLIPFGSDLDSNGNIKNISGIGNCIVKGIENNITAIRTNYDYFGKIDCYLLSPENSWIIIDYKNSSSAIPSKKSIHVDENDILSDFQMPLYYNLVTENNNKEIAAGYFYAIKDGYSRMVTDAFDYERQTLKGSEEKDLDLYNTMTTLNKYSEIFVSKVNSYDFTPTQSSEKTNKMNVKKYEACSCCNFKSICRTTYTIAGKEIKKSSNIKAENNE